MKKQLSYSDIIQSLNFISQLDKKCIKLDLDSFHQTGFMTFHHHSHHQDDEIDLIETEFRLDSNLKRMIELEEKIVAVKDQNDKLKKGIVAVSFYDADYNPGLECGICLQIFSVPIALPCSHNYCYECILQIFSPPTGKGSDKTFFQVEKCPLCRASIRLEMIPSIVLRDMANVILKDDDADRFKKMEKDLLKLKRHIGCIRLGAHCSGRMCLRPRLAVSPEVPQHQHQQGQNPSLAINSSGNPEVSNGNGPNPPDQDNISYSAAEPC